MWPAWVPQVSTAAWHNTDILIVSQLSESSAIRDVQRCFCGKNRNASGSAALQHFILIPRFRRRLWEKERGCSRGCFRKAESTSCSRLWEQIKRSEQKAFINLTTDLVIKNRQHQTADQLSDALQQNRMCCRIRTATDGGHKQHFGLRNASLCTWFSHNPLLHKIGLWCSCILIPERNQMYLGGGFEHWIFNNFMSLHQL